MWSERIHQHSGCLILVLCWLSHLCCSQQVCSETTQTNPLPKVTPDNFHASFATFTSLGAFHGHVVILVDRNSSKSAVSITESALAGSDDFKTVFDQITGQIFVINQRADPFDIENCVVQNVSSSDMFTSPVAKVTFKGVEKIIPTGNVFTGSGLKIDNEGPETINGVETVRYRSCFTSSVLQAQLEITWWYTASASTPMQVKTRRRLGSSNDILETVYVISPLRELSDKPDATKLNFAAPKGVYCKGLISAKKAPNTYERLSLGAERYVYNMPGAEPAQGPDSVRESYDLRGNISMIEGEGIFSAPDRIKYGSGVLARINDFTRGISYVKNIRFGNCSYEKVPETDWASDPSPNGAKIKTPDEFYFPNVADLQYKGKGVYRSIDVEVYIGYQDNVVDFGDGKKLPLTVEYYLDIRTSFDGTGEPVYKSIPLAVYYATTNKYNSPVEIFDFNTGVPRTYDHDISDCFAASGKLHFELVLSLEGLEASYVKYVNDYRNEFLYSLVSSLSKALNISPLRIINPQVSVFMDPLVLVEITVSERAEVPGFTPALPEAQLNAVANAMTDLIAKGTLLVDVLEGDLVFQVPVKEFANLDYRGGDCRAPGMSTGAIAGLSIGMILLGLLLGLGVTFAVLHFRKGTPGFGFSPFGGPSEGDKA